VSDATLDELDDLLSARVSGDALVREARAAIAALRIQLRTAEAEREAMRKDAERYRWLRRMSNRDDMDTDLLQMGTESELEDAIDAHLSKEPPRG
jgi:hypothetical protein